MAITRSSKAQSHIEDFSTTTTNTTASKASKAQLSASKRNSPPPTKSPHLSPSTKHKKQKPSHPYPKPTPDSHSNDKDTKNDTDSNTVTINRSPVLHLWSACIAHFLHPHLSWDACVNIGSAIASLCAVSKGKAIGMIEPAVAEESEGERKEEKKDKAKKRRETKEGATRVNVMGFDLSMKEDAAVISGAEKRVKEGNLIAKFGGEDVYARVESVMQDTLRQWEGNEDELGGRAFGMYEDFRPSVPKGPKGWGRKGDLKLGDIRSAVARD